MSISEEALAKAAASLSQAEEAPQSEPVFEEEVAEVVEEAEDSEESVEVPPSESEPDPKEEPKSKKFQQLAEREREFRQRELQFKQQAESLSQRMKALEERETKLNNPDTVFDVLDSLGMSVEQFQRGILTGHVKVEKPEVDPLAQKLGQYEKELLELKEFREQVRKQQERAEIDQHLNAYRGEIRSAVPQFENLAEWFGDSIEDAVAEAEQAAELYAQHYKEAPEVTDILSNLDAYYGKKLERFKSKSAALKASTPAKPAVKTEGNKTLTHNHTRSVAVDTSGDDVFSKVLKGNVKEVMYERALAAFKKHGQLL